jgi:hypothetical protein
LLHFEQPTNSPGGPPAAFATKVFVFLRYFDHSRGFLWRLAMALKGGIVIR